MPDKPSKPTDHTRVDNKPGNPRKTSDHDVHPDPGGKRQDAS